MTKQRERYTERSKPHRKEVSDSGAGSGVASEGMNNPVVLIALGGLLLALVLAVAVMIGRSMSDETETAATDGTPAASEAVPTTLAVTTVPANATANMSTTQETAPVSSAGQYSAPEDQKLDGTKNAYFVNIETDKGTIVGQLWPELAPETVNSFVFLAREGYFDGLTFHRVEPNFVIQGGDPNGNGTGGPGYSLKGEFSDVPHRPGIFSMARTSDPNSAGSQFFVVLPPDPASSLDNQYAVFGYTVKGMDVVTKIAKGDVMRKVTIEEKPISESIVTPDDVRAGTMPPNN